MRHRSSDDEVLADEILPLARCRGRHRSYRKRLTALETSSQPQTNFCLWSAESSITSPQLDIYSHSRRPLINPQPILINAQPHKMSREAFQAPSLPSQNQGGNNSTSFTAPSSNFEDPGRPVGYLCGDCDAKVFLKRGDPIRCKECGYRVLYKERTNRMIQFEAR